MIAIASRADAGGYSIDRFEIVGSGSIGSGGVYSLIGEVGQPDAGPMIGGFFSLAAGFLAQIPGGEGPPVQTPIGLLLSVKILGNTGVIEWPYPSNGFALQENSTLNPQNWKPSQLVVNTNGNMSVVAPIPVVDNLFFRLVRP